MINTGQIDRTSLLQLSFIKNYATKKVHQSSVPLVREELKIGRNEVIKITNGDETKEMKYKKAKPLIDSGEWRIT